MELCLTAAQSFCIRVTAGSDVVQTAVDTSVFWNSATGAMLTGIGIVAGVFISRKTLGWMRAAHEHTVLRLVSDYYSRFWSREFSAGRRFIESDIYYAANVQVLEKIASQPARKLTTQEKVLQESLDQVLSTINVVLRLEDDLTPSSRSLITKIFKNHWCARIGEKDELMQYCKVHWAKVFEAADEIRTASMGRQTPPSLLPSNDGRRWNPMNPLRAVGKLFQPWRMTQRFS